MPKNPHSTCKSSPLLTSFILRDKLYDNQIAKKFDLNSTTLLVLHHIVANWDAKKQNSSPSQETISNRINKSVRSVQRGIKELQQKDLITIQQTMLGNIYFFTENFFEAIEVTK